MFLFSRVRRRYFSEGEKRRPELTSVARTLQTFLLEKRRPSGEERVETAVFAGYHETSLSLTHFIFDSASNYSRRSLHHVPFLVSFVSWFVLIDLDMSIQSCAIGCILHFFPWFLADRWNPIQFGVHVYTGTEVLQIAARVALGMLTMLVELLQRQRVISCHLRSNFFLYYELPLS